MALAPVVAGLARRTGGTLGSFAAPSAGAPAGLALTATYDGVLARVRLVGTGLPYNVTRVELVRYDTATLTNPEDVRGGAQDASSADVVRVDDYEFTSGVVNTYKLLAYAGDTLVGTASATITPALDGIWLKSPYFPFLNQRVTVVDFSAVEMPARGGLFDVLGRRDPIAVTEVRGSRRFTLIVRPADRDAEEQLRTALSFGHTAFLHVPDGCVVPESMHAFVGDVSISRPPKHDSQARYLSLPLTQVAPPGASIVGATATYGGLASAFATYADLTAALPTYLDVAQYVAAPSDEIVG